MALLYFGRKLYYGRELFTTDGFHLAGEKTLLLSHAALHALAAVFVAVVLAWIFISRFRRAGAFLLAFFAWYVSSADYLGRYTEDRLFLIFFVLIGMSPAIEIKRGLPVVRHTGVRWVMQLFLVTLYALSGYEKLWVGDWLTDPHTLWSHLVGPYYTPLGEWIMNFPLGAWIFTTGQTVAIFELIAPLLLFLTHKPRILFVGGLIGLHVAILLLMDGLWIFSLQMIALDLVLLPDKFTASLISDHNVNRNRTN